MPFNQNLPAENTDPWYTPLNNAWTALKNFVNDVEATANSAVQPGDLDGFEKELTAGANVTIDRTDPDAPVISASGGGGGGAVDSVNGQTGVVVLDAGNVGALADEIVLADPPDTEDPNIWQVIIGGVIRFWHNEWGAIRGRNPFPDWADALVRGIRGQGDNSNGNYIELEDRRTGAPTDATKVMHGRRWSDGGLIRNGLSMSDAIVLGASDPVPSNLPAGSIIVRPSS